MIRKGKSMHHRPFFAVLACAIAVGSFAVTGHSTARADATVTTCTPDNDPAFGPSLDALDPCLADTGSPSDDQAHYSYSTAIVSHIQVPVPPTTVDALNDQTPPSV